MKSSGRCRTFEAFSARELWKVDGFHPSSEPTVLKYPAENPPVNAPWNLRRPCLSVTICSSTGIGFLAHKSSKITKK